jgi:hypothetical protein
MLSVCSLFAVGPPHRKKEKESKEKKRKKCTTNINGVFVG